MIIEKRFTALFDLDGVVFDTENQYDIFWGAQGKSIFHILRIFTVQ